VDVQWESLKLAGFGLYRDEMFISFAPALSVYCGGNEQGKSTIAAGLAAVIYGLPSTADPRSFGQGKYRNWHHPTRFEGMLTFLARGSRYRIIRNFDNHRISLQKEVHEGWQEVVGGEHNPGARKPNRVFEETIRDLLGVGNRDVFSATFYVSQPLPEADTILPETGRLLSGAGAHYNVALAVLAAQVKEITRCTGRLGITAQDMRQDRELENLAEELVAIERGIEESAAFLLTLEENTADLAKSREKLAALDLNLADREYLLLAWQEWRGLRDRYHDALLRQRSLENAWQQAQVYQKGKAASERIIGEYYSHFLSLPDEAGEPLAVLCRIQEERASLHTEMMNLQRQLAEEMKAAEEIFEALSTYNNIRGRPSLLQDCRELKRRAGRYNEKVLRRETVKNRLDELHTIIHHQPSWHLLGKSPSERIMEMGRAYQAALQNIAELVDISARLQKTEDRLNHEFELFQNADQYTLDVLSGFESLRLRYESNLSSARQMVENMQQNTEEYQKQQELFKTGYQAVSWPDNPEPVERGRRTASRHSRLISLIAALAVGVAGYLLTGSPLTALTSFAVVAATAYLLSGQWQSRRRTDVHVERIVEQRIRQSVREREVTELERKRQLLPTEDELQAASAQAAAASEQYNALLLMAEPFLNRYPDIEFAYNRWRTLREEAIELRKESSRLYRGYALAPDSGEIKDADPSLLPAPWPALAVCAGIMNADNTTVSALRDWLQTVDWVALHDDAAAGEGLQTEAIAAETELSVLDGEDPDGLMSTEIAELRQSLLPYDENTDLDGLEADIKACAALEADLSVRQSVIAETKRRIVSLTEKDNALQAKAMPLKAGLEYLLENGEPFAEVLADWHKYQTEKKKKLQHEKELAAVYGAYGVDGSDKLQEQQLDAANRAGAIWLAMDELRKRHPGLPEMGQGDTAVLEEQYRHLMESVAEMRGEQQTLAGSIREQEFALARLEGQSAINIPAAQERLDFLRLRHSRLQREAAALQIAYSELSAAVSEYSKTYRIELAEKVSSYFRQITGASHRFVTVSETLQVEIREEGRGVAPAQLSQGARDQLYISLRLAIADLLSHDIRLPFIFDDPFVNWDNERIEQIRQLLAKLSSQRQIILFTHNQAFSGWGQCSQIKVENKS
jgi:chromosome segregation protein